MHALVHKYTPKSQASWLSLPRSESLPRCLIFQIFSRYSIHLPGQGKMLHSWYSRDGPRQGMPPYLGSGLLQTRFRFRMPLLQSRLHCDHDVQADQAPLTVWAEYLPARRKSPERPAKEEAEVFVLEVTRVYTNFHFVSVPALFLQLHPQIMLNTFYTSNPKIKKEVVEWLTSCNSSVFLCACY